MFGVFGKSLKKAIDKEVAQLMGRSIKPRAVRMRSIKLIGKGDAKWK